MDEKKKMPAALDPLKFRAAVYDQIAGEDVGFSNYSAAAKRSFFS